MSKVWNYYAGPCMLPDEVMDEAQRDFRNFANTGMGLVEISHRSAEFDKVAKDAEALLRELLNVPSNYKIIFEQGGGRGQFAAIPMNLLSENGTADYFVTGHWSRCAYKECAEKYGNAVLHECSYQDESGVWHVDYSKMTVSENSEYCYICLNETVNGIESFTLPDTKGVPLIADMSSDIMTRPIDVSKFGAIIFGLQKNVGPSGMTITIVREDLLGKARKYCPSILDWSVLSKFDSMYNTPCTFAWYMAYLNFKWIKNLGGVEELERRNIKKSKMLYDYIDSSDFYISKIAANDRSRVNCVFTLKDESLNDDFLKLSKAKGLIGLKGHKVLGGMRASIYNAMPIEGVQILVDFLKEFAASHS